jgi:hypothetical protein
MAKNHPHLSEPLGVLLMEIDEKWPVEESI